MDTNESPQREGAPGSGGPSPIVADSAELALAFADRHAGIEANQAANTTILRDDRQRVEDAITVLAASGEPFTADHLHARVMENDPTEYDRLLLASAIGTWSRAGRIIEDWARRPVPSTQRSRHGSRLRWWYGNPSANPSGNPFGKGDGELHRHGDAEVERHAPVDRDVTAQSTVTDAGKSRSESSRCGTSGIRPESVRNPSGTFAGSPGESPRDRGLW